MGRGPRGLGVSKGRGHATGPGKRSRRGGVGLGPERPGQNSGLPARRPDGYGRSRNFPQATAAGAGPWGEVFATGGPAGRDLHCRRHPGGQCHRPPEVFLRATERLAHRDQCCRWGRRGDQGRRQGGQECYRVRPEQVVCRFTGDAGDHSRSNVQTFAHPCRNDYSGGEFLKPDGRHKSRGQSNGDVIRAQRGPGVGRTDDASAETGTGPGDAGPSGGRRRAGRCIHCRGNARGNPQNGRNGAVTKGIRELAT